MAIYNGTQKVKPSGIAKVYVGSQLVYQNAQPTPYRRLDYIQSVYGQSMGINLNFYATNDTKIDIDLTYFRQSYTGWGPLYGTRGTTALSGGQYFGLWINAGSRNVSPNWGTFDPGNNSGLNFTAGTKYNIRTNGGQLYLDGVLKPNASTTATLNTSQRSFGLLCVYEAASSGDGFRSTGFEANIYRCKIYEGSTITRNLVPVQRKSDSVCGLYDIENDVFYTSVTSTGFVAGNTVEENWNYTDPDA